MADGAVPPGQVHHPRRAPAGAQLARLDPAPQPAGTVPPAVAEHGSLLDPVTADALVRDHPPLVESASGDSVVILRPEAITVSHGCHEGGWHASGDHPCGAGGKGAGALIATTPDLTA
jgi:hypothetical protein